MDCKCGHGISKHDMGGCQHVVRKTGEFDLVCKCGLTPDTIAESQLTTLREAGEKMAERLRNIDKSTPALNAIALKAWEAANK